MPATYTLIASNTLSSSAVSVTLSAIPNSFTDLVLRFSGRNDRADTTVTNVQVTVNNSSTGDYSYTRLFALNTTSAGSARGTSQAQWLNYSTSDSVTSNTFSSNELYFPNYAGTANKVMSSFDVSENNATTASSFAVSVGAYLRSNTDAITSITLTQSSGWQWLSGSSFFLYGIKNT